MSEVLQHLFKHLLPSRTVWSCPQPGIIRLQGHHGESKSSLTFEEITEVGGYPAHQPGGGWLIVLERSREQELSSSDVIMI